MHYVIKDKGRDKEWQKDKTGFLLLFLISFQKVLTYEMLIQTVSQVCSGLTTKLFPSWLVWSHRP